jgi:hypothetical protein
VNARLIYVTPLIQPAILESAFRQQTLMTNFFKTGEFAHEQD